MKYRFDNILVEPDRRRVLIEGVPAKIGARAYDILLALIERRERVVSKNELFDLVWPNAIVEEGNLQVHIFALRKLIGAHAIATVPGRGYQFVGAIEHQTDSEPSFLPRARPVGASWAQLTNLQPNATPLYGRDVDTSSLRALITQHRLVSIVGPGGVGKTRRRSRRRLAGGVGTYRECRSGRFDRSAGAQPYRWLWGERRRIVGRYDTRPAIASRSRQL
jgi:DNA-binding winged helix-turn-helix (wHTH) protein